MRPAGMIRQARISLPIIRQRGFHAVGFDQDIQKHQACGGSFKFVGGKGYAHLREWSRGCGHRRMSRLGRL